MGFDDYTIGGLVEGIGKAFNSITRDWNAPQADLHNATPGNSLADRLSHIPNLDDVMFQYTGDWEKGQMRADFQEQLDPSKMSMEELDKYDFTVAIIGSSNSTDMEVGDRGTLTTIYVQLKQKGTDAGNFEREYSDPSDAVNLRWGESPREFESFDSVQTLLENHAHKLNVTNGIEYGVDETTPTATNSALSPTTPRMGI